MPNTDAATVRRQILRRLRSGEKVAAIAAETGSAVRRCIGGNVKVRARQQMPLCRRDHCR